MRTTVRLVRLHIRRWRATRARTLLSIVGITAGSATVVAVLALTGSLAASVRHATTDLAVGADLQVSGITEGGFDTDVVEAVVAADGVGAAAPMVRTSVRFGAKEALLIGVDRRILDFAGEVVVPDDAGPGPDSDLPPIVIGEGLARETGLATDDTVTVSSPGGTQTAIVAAVVDDDRLARVNGGVVAVADLPVAQLLAGKGDRVDAVLVRAATGTAVGDLERDLRAVVAGRAVVDSPALLVDQANSVTGTVTSGMVLAGALTVGMGGFLVYTTMSMAALERRRELATMRAIGGPRRPLLRSFVGEAALLGLVGSLLGAVLGALTASSLVSALPPFLLASFGVRIGFSMPAAAVPLGVAAGVGAAVIAAVLPARRALTVAPVEAMRPEGILEDDDGRDGRVVWGQVTAGAALIVIGFLWFEVAPKSMASGGGFALATIGAPILLLGIEGPLTRALSWVARRFRTSGSLAAASLARAPRRVWSTTVAVLMGVGLVVGNGGLVNSTSRSLVDNVAAGPPPDLYVTATTDGNAGNGFLGTTTLLPDAWAEEIAAIDGVEVVGGTQFSYATLGRRRVVLEGISDGAIDPSLRGVAGAAKQAVLDGEGVIVSTTLAGALDLSAESGNASASEFLLPTASGDVPLRVVAVVESFRSNQGVAVVSLDLLQATSGRPGVSSYDITLTPGADRAEVAAAVVAITQGSPFPVTVQTGEELHADIKAAVAQSTAAFVALQWVIVIAASLAVLNTLVISVVERRRELGILRALGTSRRTVVRMVLAEATAVGIGGTVLGVLSGFVLSLVGVRGLARSTETPIHFAFSVQPIALAIVAGAVVCLLGGALPARRAGRVEIVAAIGYE